MSPYCKAYALRGLREFNGWSESQDRSDESTDPGGGAKDVDAAQDGTAQDGADRPRALSDDDIVFIHQDFTVTQSMWHGENVIFNRVSPEWESFCVESLGFEIPSDIGGEG